MKNHPTATYSYIRTENSSTDVQVYSVGFVKCSDIVVNFWFLNGPKLIIVDYNEYTADRAKQIKCTAKVNEDPTAQLIRELQEENEKLKQMLAGGKVDMSLMEGEDTADMTDEGLFPFRVTSLWIMLKISKFSCF